MGNIFRQEWIPMRVDLANDPRVCVMADSLSYKDGEYAKHVGRSEMCALCVTDNALRNAVVGGLVAVWGRFRHHGVQEGNDLVVRTGTVFTIDDITGMPGFGFAMQEVRWLLVREDVENDEEMLVFPNFFEDLNSSAVSFSGKNNGSSARQKAYRERKKAQESVTEDVTRYVTEDVTECNENDVTSYVKEKKRKSVTRGVTRKDNSPPVLPDLPENLLSISTTLQDWLTYKAERRESYKPTGLKQFVSRASSVAEASSPEAVADKMRRAMASGWAGWDHEATSFGQPMAQSDIPF